MNVRLCDRTEAHVRTYFARTRDPEIMAMIPQSADTVEKAVADYERSLLPGATSFGRTIYADDAYIGDVWCYCIDLDEEANAMLSYCIFEKSLWAKGIATEAVRQFMNEIVSRFDLKTVGAFAYCSNMPSLRVLEKNGFEKQEEFTEDGVLSAYYQKETDL